MPLGLLAFLIAWPAPSLAANADPIQVGIWTYLLGVGLTALYYRIKHKKSADAPELPSYLYESGSSVISKELRDMLGYEGAEDRLEALEDFFEPVDFTQLLKLFETLKEQGSADPALVKRANLEQWLECWGKARFYTGKGSKPVTYQIVIWFRDVTQLYRQQLRSGKENEKLRAENRRLSLILNTLPYPVWQRGEDLAIRYCNPAYSDAVEETPDKTVESTALELDKRVRLLAMQARQIGQARSERRHIIVNGERRLYLITEIPVPGESLLIGTAQDVTEAEKLQEELQRHISAQSDLLESSASATAIYGADMRLRFFNAAFVQLWKFDERWLSTQPTYSEVLEALRERRALPEQANFQAFKQQQVKLFTDLLEPHQEFFYLPDGRALRVIVIPHALGGLLFTYDDVTDRLALERSYNTLIAVQKETLDKLHEGVAVFGEDGRLKLSNPTYLKLWQLDKHWAQSEPHITEIIDRCRDFYLTGDWEETRRRLIERVQSRTHSYQRLERSDGSVIDWNCVPLPDGATLATYDDVTDSTLVERSLREKNEALQEADRLKSEFLANVSYELRSPLTSIIGFSDMLRQHYFGDLSEKQKEYVEGIHQSSEHLMQLINDILDLASIEAGYMTLEVHRFDVHNLLSSMLALIHERVRELDISLRLECPPRIGKMLGDEIRLKQILFNLLSNAIKYSAHGGSIVLGAQEKEKAEIELWVQDQGVGIPLEEQQAVFDKFYKGSSQEPQKVSPAHRSGTGLGLSIVRSFVELHGGRVELQSTPGQGTRVICILPRENPDLHQYMRTKTRRVRAAA